MNSPEKYIPSLLPYKPMNSLEKYIPSLLPYKPRNSPEKNIYHHCYHINQGILLKRIYAIIVTIYTKEFP